jgi:hypothetical protein
MNRAQVLKSSQKAMGTYGKQPKAEWPFAGGLALSQSPHNLAFALNVKPNDSPIYIGLSRAGIGATY